MGKDINQYKLVGGKRKNGHKQNCMCHICENMKNKAKRGGYEEELEKEKEKMMGGSKKKNGHRMDCNCPICKNMKNSKRNKGSKSGRKTKKMRGGDNESDMNESDMNESDMNEPDMNEEVMPTMGGKKKMGNGHKPGCQCPICKNMRKKKGGATDEESNMNVTSDTQPTTTVEDNASDQDYDELDAAEKGEAGLNVVGGTRKRRGGKKWGGKRKTRKTRKYK
jgi:hypothetical protein